MGQRARILQPRSYCSFLWGQEGTIEEVHGKLFLRFDEKALRHPEDTMGMNGVYLRPGAFEVLG